MGKVIALLLGSWIGQYSPPPSSGGSGGGASWFGGSITAPVPANWSQIGTGCANSTVTGVTGGVALQTVSTSSTQNLCGWQITAAAGDFSHVFIFYAVVSSLNFATVEVGFTDGTKLEWCGNGAGDGTTTNLPIVTQAKASALTGGSVSAANGASTYRLPFNSQSGPSFFRLSRTGTNLACDASPDGVNWINLFNDTSPFLTASALYFGADPRGADAISLGTLQSYK